MSIFKEKKEYFFNKLKTILVFLLFFLFIFLSLNFKNNSELNFKSDDKIQNFFLLMSQKRYQERLVESKKKIGSLKNKGCEVVLVDNQILDGELTKIAKKISCQKWKLFHLDSPKKLKAIYFNSYAAVNERKIQKLIQLAKEKKINAVVIDVKEVDGKVAYDMSNFSFGKIKPSSNLIIKNPKKLIQRLHKEGIYLIGRIVVFKDTYLAEKYPEYALKDKKTNKVWKDRSGKKYLDPASKDVWEYSKNLARAIYLTGFDEINFDYVRYPSDGSLSRIKYLFSGKEIERDEKWGRAKILDSYFNYLTENLRKEFPEIKLSADFFGQTALEWNDLKIGQILEDGLLYFDRIGPMVYPSHFNPHFIGLNTADSHPYEVIRYSMNKISQKINFINKKINEAKKNKTNLVLRKNFVVKKDYQKLEKITKDRIIPWFQAFSCTWCKGYIIYSEKEVLAQIKAAESEGYNSWFLWNAASNYSSYFK